LWTRQLNAMDWSTEGRTAPTLHHTVHQGFRPEAITQRMLALYGDRVDRSLFPPEETPPLLASMSTDDMCLTGHHEFAMDDFPTSPIFVPRDPGADPKRSSYAGSDPGGHDGFIVVPVVNDDGFRVEVFDAHDVGRGSRCTIAERGMTLPFVLHSAWMPRAVSSSEGTGVRFSDELDRIDELPDDLAQVARQVAADLDDRVPIASRTAPR